MPDPGTPGWEWFSEDAGADAGPPTADPRELARLFARCFSGQDGDCLIAYLRAISIERTFAASVPAPVLRHAEGQRQLVSHIISLVARGRQGDV